MMLARQRPDPMERSFIGWIVDISTLTVRLLGKGRPESTCTNFAAASTLTDGTPSHCHIIPLQAESEPSFLTAVADSFPCVACTIAIVVGVHSS
ncbi:hypothetical protein GJ744_006819 [Endocarpon pusillum]|uniref:Uncharacterized protein n=1 Tax=Endocarpon pusillum TaxID=364733 RepID=A0A8H7AJM1_9EURO|nr:hypothetical protein GJ744_006819 [Endocarpon pusillum]